MKNYTTMTLFTLTNIIQFGIVIKVITPPIICYSSCLASAMSGLTLVPCFITMAHTLDIKMNCIYRAAIIFATSFIPFVSSVGAQVALHYCFDKNWYIWFVQGSTVPAMFWTTYKMLFPSTV